MVTTAPTLDDAGHDLATEAWLDSLGVAWHFDPAAGFDRIDWAASKANQARLEPLNDEVVERYTADYERGDTFPPVLVRHPRGRPLAVLIGGNHRLTAAARAGRTSHAAYVLDVDDDLEALRLAYLDNRRHGLAPSDDERVLQAAHLIAAQGITQAEAAAVVGLSIGKLSRGMAVIKADERARELGVDAWPTLAKTVRWRLSSLDSDPVFEAAARLAVYSEMGADDAYSLVRQLMATTDDVEAMHIIGETEEAMSERRRGYGGARLKATPRARMLESLRIVASLDVGAVVAGCSTEDHRKVLRDSILAAAQTMAKVEARLR